MRTLWLCGVAAPLCGGCTSAVERISSTAQSVSTDAQSIVDTTAAIEPLLASAHSNVQDITLTLPAAPRDPSIEKALAKAKAALVDIEAIRPHLRTIAATASSIDNSASTILDQVPRVQDRVPWWATLLNRLLWIGGVAGVAFLLWYLGLWPVIRRFLALLFGWTALLPSKTAASAKLDYEALSLPTADPQQREAVAVRRATNRDYDAAYRLYAKKGSQPPPPTQ